MEPMKGDFYCHVSTYCNVFSTNIKINGDKEPITIEKIVKAFEKVIAEQSSRTFKKLPRSLVHDGVYLNKDIDLVKTIDQLKVLGIEKADFKLPVSCGHLFKEGYFRTPYWAEGQCEILGQLGEKVLPDTEIEVMLTFSNTGPIAWPSDIRCQHTFKYVNEGVKIKVEPGDLRLKTKHPVPPGEKWVIPFKFKTPHEPKTYYHKFRLQSREESKLGKAAIISLRVGEPEKKIQPAMIHVTDLVIPDVFQKQLKYDESKFKNREERPTVDEDMCSMAMCDAFENDVLYKEISAIFYPDTFVTKSFGFANNGRMNWDQGLKLRYRFEHLDTKETEDNFFDLKLKKSGLDQGSSIEENLEFRTPSIPGPYFMTLKLVSRAGIDFGQEIRLQFHVITNPTADKIEEFTYMQKLAHLTRFGFDKANCEDVLEAYNDNLMLSLATLLDMKFSH